MGGITRYTTATIKTYNSVEEWKEEAIRRFGPDQREWKFVCPACGNVQTVKEFEPYWSQRANQDTARYHCIGRYTHPNNDAFGQDKPCTYTLGGLIRLTKVIIKDGENEHHCFAFADKEA